MKSTMATLGMNSPAFDSHRDAWLIDGKEVPSIYLDDGRWYLPLTKEVALVGFDDNAIFLKPQTAAKVLREPNSQWLISRYNMIFHTNWR